MYALLLINFVFYIGDDIRAASFELRNGGTFFEWTEAFATTIDMTAWFILLFLFELETYVFSDKMFERVWVMRFIQGVRLICYVSLAHSVWAFSNTYYDLVQVKAVADVTDLCQLIGPDVSFVRNLVYKDLVLDNCATLSAANEFYFTTAGLVVTDAAGLQLEKNLALADLTEVFVWLAILLSIEAMVRLQDKNITSGTAFSSVKGAKYVLYTILWGLAAYWFSLGHYRFAYDEALWIFGFLTIEMNVARWRKEIDAQSQTQS